MPWPACRTTSPTSCGSSARDHCKRRWQRLAEKLGVAKHIQPGWAGCRIARPCEQYAWADAFVFSSLRDTTGTVVVEALAAGVPVICLDHQGVHDVVTDECGLKIPVTTPREVVARLSEAIARLARDGQQWERLSRGAIDRAREYLWSRHEDVMVAQYRETIAARQGHIVVPNSPHLSSVRMSMSSPIV